ncbi:MAG TPA: hypothetical protein VFX14_17915 [Methylomirabilota bacterium]|nr:hypothetical protein [Methylomirabilota bacterium]
MMRHLFILARDRAALGAPLTIALDRHLARGEQIDIMPDRRNTDGTRAPQWPTGRERRRSGLAEQIAVQGYAICSRQEDHPPVAGATAPRRDPAAAPGRGPMERGPMAPPPAPPRPFAEGPRSVYDERRPEIEEMRAARAEAELAREAGFRGRMGGRRLSEPLLDDEDWSSTGEDPYGEEPTRRRGFFAGLTSAFATALILAVAGAFLFAPQIRDFVTVLTEPRRAAVESTGDRSRTLTASEETAGRSAAPAAPSSSAPAPTPMPATPASPAPSGNATPPREVVREPAAAPPRQSAQEPAALPSRQSSQQPTRSASASRDTGARREAAPPAEPTPARDAALPPRETEAARELPPPSLPPRRAELTSAGATRTERLPDFPGLPRVDVTRAPGQDGTTFTVRLTDQRGSPMSGAQVTLRQKSNDGYVRETTLEPIAPAGSYRGAVPIASGRQSLTVRVVLGDRRVEMPVSE